MSICDYVRLVVLLCQAKEDLKEITHKVYFDVEIDGKSAGMIR